MNSYTWFILSVGLDPHVVRHPAHFCSLVLYINPPPVDDMRMSPDNETPAVDQLYHQHDLSCLSPHFSTLPVLGCWHMVCVPQLVHRRLSWAGTRDQGRAHSPGDFLQQPCTLQL